MEHTLDYEDPHTAVENSNASFDYTYVTTTARVAVYDDLRSAPRVTEIHPAETASYIESLASTVYNQARQAGGAIPYTVIKEVSENFIHARFKEIVVSVIDGGQTIRFADQGPGITHKEKAQMPGFSSAIEPMKKYIRGVGSGLPLVKDYLEFSHGNITIEDNMGTGAVVTISMGQRPDEPAYPDAAASPANMAAGEGRLGQTWPQNQANPQPDLPGYGNQAMCQINPQETHFEQTHFAPVYPPQSGNSHEMTFPSTAGVPGTGEFIAYGSPAANAGGYPAPQAYQQAGYAQQLPQPHPAQGVPGGYAGYDPVRNSQSLMAHEAARIQMALAPLSQKERDFLPILLSEGAMGVTDMKDILEMPNSSIHNIFKKLEQAGLVEQRAGKKRMLTPLGQEVAAYVLSLS